MYYDSDDFLMMLVFIAVALAFVAFVRRRLSGASQPAAAQGSTTPKPQPTTAARMAEDMRATQTSRVVDAVSILDDLSETSANYRHYCELVGNSMATSNTIAPYSKRAVAYYDIKCYRIDAAYGGGERETLVAHEHSFDPFSFTDASSDTPIYVDLESFGTNVILVNSTNHIEGPNSDFSKAFQQNAVPASGSAGATGAARAYALAAPALALGGNWLSCAGERLRVALARALAKVPKPSLRPAPAFALALATPDGAPVDAAMADRGPRILQAAPGRPGSPQGHRGRGGGRPSGQPHPPKPGPQRGVTVPLGNTTIHLGPTPGHMPEHLGDFMGGYGGGPWVMGGGPGHGRRPAGPSSTDLILGMGLGALLNSMATTQQMTSATGSADTFRGYRLVENIVPLGSPVYCIGEIYRHGTDVYMSRSLAKDYPTSYFATRPEAEVLSALGG